MYFMANSTVTRGSALLIFLSMKMFGRSNTKVYSEIVLQHYVYHILKPELNELNIFCKPWEITCVVNLKKK